MSAGRRYLIAAGTALYDHLPRQPLPSVESDLQAVADWFTRHGCVRVLPQLGANPTCQQLRDGLGAWLADPTHSARDTLVLYYSGHGERVDDDAHYLIARDTRFGERGPLAYSALADDELARYLAASNIQHALVILDTCYAAQGITGLSAKAGQMLAKRRWDESAPRGIYLVAAARSRDKAAEHAFARAFVDVIANPDGRLGGRTQAYLEPNAVVGAVNAIFAQRQIRQVAEWIPASALRGDLAELIPNPRFEHGRPAGLDLEDHWLPKASDFSGRERALRELSEWLTAGASDGRMRVVTGAPGAGKSALIARLVTLPGGSPVDLAVHARGKSLEQIVAEIGAAIGARLHDVDALIEALRAREQRLALVVDALDEAAEPRQIARRLLRDLARLPALRLVVGSRPDSAAEAVSPRVKSLGSNVVVIDLDRAEYLGENDVRDYVLRRLLAESEPDRRTPYRGNRELATRVADAVAERAKNVFLIARIVSQQLVDADAVVDVADPAWRERFPAEVGTAFDEFLDRFDDDAASELDKRSVVELLRPLAYGFGAGLPWDALWVSVASALARREYADDDVNLLLQHAGAYIVEASEHARSVYRLYHEALAEWLRDDRGVDARDAHRAIVVALEALVPRVADAQSPRDWRRAHPYLLAHLASHAEAAGLLDALVCDPLFLAVAERDGLLRALSSGIYSLSGEGPRQIAAVYERAAHHLDAPDPAERVSYLELAAHQVRDGHVFLALAARSEWTRPWQVVWAALHAAPAQRIFAQGNAPVRQVFVLEESLQLLTVWDHEWRLIDLRDGADVYDAVRLPDGERITATAIAAWGGESLLVAADAAARLALWRIGDGALRRIWDTDAAMRVESLAAARDGDRLLLAVGGWRPGDAELGGAIDAEDGDVGVLEAWDLIAGTRVNDDAWPLPGGPVRALAATSLDGVALLVSADANGAADVWRLADGAHLAHWQADEHRAVTLLQATVVDGALTIVSASGESIAVWTMIDGAVRLAHPPRAGHADGVLALSLAQQHGEALVLSCGRDHVVRTWRIADSECLQEFLSGFSDRPCAIAPLRTERAAAIVTGHAGGSVRLWRTLGGGAAAGSADGSAGYLESLALLHWDGAPQLISRSRQREVRRWDPATGAEVDLPAAIPVDNAIAVATFHAEPATLIVSCDADGVIRAWDAASGTAVGVPIETGVTAVRRIAVGRHRQRRVVAVLHRPHRLAWYDLDSGAALGEPTVVWPYPEHESDALDLCFAQWGDELIAIDAANRDRLVWHTAAGERNEVRAKGTPRARAFAASAAVCSGDRVGVVVADRDGSIESFDLSSGERLGESLMGPPWPRLAAARIDSDWVVVAGGESGRVQAWRGGRLLASIDTDCTLTDLVIVPDAGVAVAAREGLMLLRIGDLLTRDASLN